MINLSTTAPVHSYACRSGGSNVVVVNTVAPLGDRRQHRRRAPSTRHSHHSYPANSSPDGVVVAGGIDLLGEGFVGINGFRNNRFQYQIPTVGQHYGNAFHLGDDDEEATELVGDRDPRHPHAARDGTGDAAMYLQDIIGDHTNDDDDDEDVEMSTAVEVISIDPNCDYDTEDELDDDGEGEGDEDEEEEDVEYEDEEEDDCAPTVQEFAGGWVSKDGVTGWVPAPGQTGELVAHNVSLTVDVAHEVIGGLEENLAEQDEDDVGDIHCNVVTMPSGEAILPKVEKEEEGGRSRSNSCNSTASSSSHSSTSSSSSSNSSSSATTNASNRSSKSIVFSSRVKLERNEGPSLEFSPTKGIPFEPPEQLLQVKEESPTPPPGRQIGRRKRTTSSQRRSFSMPHSPVGVGNAIDALAPMSLSFEDLDSLVLSPLKALAGGGVKVSESDLDDSLVEELANDGSFDLAEYITGDDSTTSCDTHAGYFSARKRQKAEQPKPTLPLHPKSRGKELKVLRQLMLPQKPTRSQMGARVVHTETPTPVSNAAGHEECPTQTSLNGRRSCTAKVLSRLTVEDDSSDSAEDDLADESTPEVNHRKKEPAAGVRKGKRKAADDAEKDPTWNPNGVGANKPLHHAKADGGRVQHHKQSSQSSPQCAAAVSKPSPRANSDDSGNEKASPAKVSAVTPIKGVKFGQVVRKEHPNSSTSSSTSTTTVVVTKKPPLPATTLKPDQSRTNVLRKKTNVKLDHDYCSPKNGSLQAAGGLAAVTGGAVGGCQRKAIEIPFLLPTKDQLRHERKLQKEKKRNEQHTVAKKAQEQAMGSCSDGGAADNSKDKQTRHHLPGSSSSNGASSSSNHSSAVQKTPQTSVTSSPVHSIDSRRTAIAVVDKSFVHNSASSPASSDTSANEVTQSSKAKLLPTSNTGATVGVGAVKRQVSLLKINQQIPTVCAVDAATASPRPSNDDANGNHVSSPVARVAGNESGGSSPAVKCEEKSTQPDNASGASLEQGVAVVVRRKLNLQEYKKRREHPENTPPQTVVDGGSVSKIGPNVFPSDPRRRAAPDVPSVNGGLMPAPTSDKTSDRTVNVASGYSGGSAGLAGVSVSSGTTATQAVIKQEPLDPISAAKKKALRMQQLKKEAAIKSHEAKLSQKTMPLMPIVPLAQITSLEFDEHGNPLSLDEARARAKAGVEDGRDSFKLHPDYEEIVIVSVGCNTALTIVPGELEPAMDPLVVRPSSNGGAEIVGSQQQQQQQLKNASDKDASLLMGIKDTLKRCCPSVGNMPGSSLIASIQEVMIKKSNNIAQSVASSAAAQTAEVISVAETAITLKTEPGTGGVGGGQEQYLLMQQSSPSLGVSPPSSFSPGKPERAHTPSLSACQAIHKKQVHTIKSADTDGTTLKSVAASQTTANGEMSEPSAASEHGEDKVIMHLRKDRPRPPSAQVATQTEPSGRFAPLRKLSPRNSGPPLASVEPRNGGTEVACTRQSRHPVVGGQQRSERRYRSRRRDGSESSGAESDGGRRRSNRSKSRSGRDQLHPSHHHHHHRKVKREDRSRSRHGSSRRRSSRSRSGSRSRSRSTYSHRVHRDEHRDQHQQQHHQHHGSNNGAGGHYSRGRRKSRTSSRSSSSSLLSRRGRRSMSASSSASSSSASSRSSSRSRRSRSPRSSSLSRSNSRLSGLRSATPPDQRYQSRERLNHRRPMSPERKIVYIGRLECNIRKEDLQQKFQPYGKIVKITLHSKDNGVRYGFVTFEKPQHAYSAIDASANDPNLREYDVSFGGRRAFCRMQYADLDGELSNDLDHHIPYVAMDGSLVLPPRAPIAYGGVPMCHKDPTVGQPGAGGAGDSFEDLLMQFKKGIGAMKAPRKT